MAQIIVENLTFAYDGGIDYIFKGANFRFDSNWKLGLIGRNGRGKTTFLKLLLGKFEYQGKIVSCLHFDYFPYQVKNKGLNIVDVLAEIDPELELWKVMIKMNELSLNQEVLYRPFESLSFGEQTKFLLAALFAKDNNFLLIDEPTNHLDRQARDNVCEFLKRQKGFIVVSHDRDFLDACTDHIISINKNDIEVQKGNFTSWWQNRQNQDNFEKASNEKLQKEISHLNESIKKTKVWADKIESGKNGNLISGVKADKGYIGHMAAKMNARSKATLARQERLVEEKSKLLKNIEEQEGLFLNSVGLRSENVLEVRDLSIRYGDKEVFKELSFSVKRGEKVAVCGKNGCGKSSLLKLLLGEDIDYRGQVFKSGNLKISYVSQNFDFLTGSLFDIAFENQLDQTKFLTMLKKLGFDRKLFENRVESYSAGQKKKVLIAKSLCQEANLYIWDEPLNYIDIISRMQIEQMLLESDITLIFVEHDSAFVRNVASKKVEI